MNYTIYTSLSLRYIIDVYIISKFQTYLERESIGNSGTPALAALEARGGIHGPGGLSG